MKTRNRYEFTSEQRAKGGNKRWKYYDIFINESDIPDNTIDFIEFLKSKIYKLDIKIDDDMPLYLHCGKFFSKEKIVRLTIDKHYIIKVHIDRSK